jgi:tRNA(adenine34) deaminase
MAETFSEADERWMQRALELATRAQRKGEVPVGAVVVRDDEALGEGWNRPIGLNDPSAHAEILALRQAGERAANYRLPGSTLYVTLEPCAMCVGAMIHARVARVVFGAADPKTGALGGAFDLQALHAHNHVIDVRGGLLATEAGELLRTFFRTRR